jgi:hypothetical protein
VTELTFLNQNKQPWRLKMDKHLTGKQEEQNILKFTYNPKMNLGHGLEGTGVFMYPQQLEFKEQRKWDYGFSDESTGRIF